MDSRFRFTSIAFCVAALGSSSCGVQAMPPGRIAFETTSYTSAVYVMNADGSDQIRLGDSASGHNRVATPTRSPRRDEEGVI